MRKETNAECLISAIGVSALMAIGLYLITSLTGCAAVLGVKSYESGKNADGSEWSRWAFTQGVDVGASINTIDEVQNTRGIKPGGVQSDK